MDADLLALRIKVTGGKAGAGEVKLVRDEAGRLRDEQGRYVKEQTQQTKQQEENVKRQTRVTSAAFKKQAAMMQSTGRTMTYGLTLPLGLVGVAAIKTAADFTKSMAQVGVATGLGGRKLDTLKDYALEMGAKTIFSANESAEAMLNLAKAGLTPAQITGGALKSTMALAAAGSMELAEAGNLVGSSMKTFRLEAKDSGAIADALAGGANKSAADVKELATSLSQAGQAAAMNKLTLNETVGTLAAMADQGLRGSDAGTSLKTFLMRLNPVTKKAKEEMANLNLTFFDAHGRFVGMEAVSRRLQGALGDMTDKQRNAAIQILFGSDAQRAANIVYRSGPGIIARYTKATEERGAAERMANAQMKGLPGALERAKGSLETAALVLGEALAPAIVTVAGAVEGLANGFTTLPPEIQTTIAVVGTLAALAGPVLWFAGSMSKAVIAIRELRAAEAVGGGGLLGKMTKGRMAAGVGGLAAFGVGGAVGGTPGAAIGNIGGGAAMGFAAGGPWGAAIGGGLGAAATLAPVIMDLFKAKPSKMAQEVTHLSDAMGSYKSAARGLDRLERRAAKAKHQHTVATQAERRASDHLVDVLAQYGPNSTRATRAQRRLSEAQREVRRTAEAESKAHQLSGFRLKAFRIQSLHATASIKQLVPQQRRRIRTMREEVNHGRTGIEFLNELERLEKRVGREKKQLTNIYAEAESKTGKPWADRLQKLTTLQARYGNQGKTLVTRLAQQRTELQRLKQTGSPYERLVEDLRETKRLLAEIRLQSPSTGGNLGKHPTRPGKNAAGTNFWRGGLTWLAERGPELVNLPRGAKVTPAPATRRLLGAVGDPQPSSRVAGFSRSDGSGRVLVPVVVKVGRRELANVVVEAQEDAKARL